MFGKPKEEKRREKEALKLAKKERKEELAAKRQNAIDRRKHFQEIFVPTIDYSEVAFDDENKLVRIMALFPTYIEYDDIRGYDIIKNNVNVSHGGFGSAIVGGALFGSAGAVAGSVIGKKNTTMASSLSLQIYLKNPERPSVSVDYITSQTKTDGFIYQAAEQRMHQVIARLELLIEEQQPSIASNANPYDEVRQLKELLDMGAITDDEFDRKKKELLSL